MYLGLVLKTSAAKAALFHPSALRENPIPPYLVRPRPAVLFLPGESPLLAGGMRLNTAP